MPGLFSRVKTWVSTEDVEYDDLNAEFDNVLTNFVPLMMDDYSANVAQMQTVADPGEVGTESLATTLAGELARIRKMLVEITGEDYWYESPTASLLGIANSIGTGLSRNRLVSGRVLSTSAQPSFLVPNGAARTVKCDGTPTAFVYYVNGTSYSISTDVTLTSLTAAPSSNNTCLINDTNANDQYWTKHTGEDGTEIPVDNMGSEISALVGKFAAFKLAGVGTEYFIAYVDSTTRLTKAKRGYFFDSSDAAIPRTGYANNDTITLMKLTWIFAKTDGTLTATYNNPTWSKDEPASPSLGDYWYDTDNDTWKTRSVSTWDSAGATIIGCCIQDTSNTIGARSFEYFKSYSAVGNMELMLGGNTTVKSRHPGSIVSVWGESIRTDHNIRTWDITLDLDSGVSETASTYYYFYLTEEGDQIISDVKPYDRREDLQGYYHTHQSWRCIGYAFNDGSQNLGAVESYYRQHAAVQIMPSQTATMNIEVVPKIIKLDGSGGAFSEHLPAAALCRGLEYVFIRTDSTIANVITLDAFGAETINGAATTTLNTQYEAVALVSDGTSWYIRQRTIPSAWSADEEMVWTSSVAAPVLFGTVAVNKIKWLRRGKYARTYLEYRQTAAPGGGAQSGTYGYRIAMPTALVIDTSIIGVNTTGNLHDAQFEGLLAGAVGGNSGANTVGFTAGKGVAYDTGTFRLTGEIGGTIGTFGLQLVLSSTAMEVSALIDIPITGWND